MAREKPLRKNPAAPVSALFLAAALTGGGAWASVSDAPVSDDQAVVASYAELAARHYGTALTDAEALAAAVDALVAAPSQETLDAAKRAWLVSRESYGVTEAHRFYGGPIDGVDPATGIEGPEGLLNSWPVNEAHLDYVKGRPDAGLISKATFVISPAAIAAGNQVSDEADVTTGYHAVEFLLWGQDLGLDGPGNRPFADYASAPNAERRGAYLKAVTAKLVDDLAYVAGEWAPGADNYRAGFETRPTTGVLSDLLGAQATMAGFELASERIAVALDSGDPEDEHSCFSDNTHRDFVRNVAGVAAVWWGDGGPGLRSRWTADNTRAQAVDAALADVEALADEVERLGPVDTILASEEGSDGRVALSGLSDALVEVAEAMVVLGEASGLEVVIGGE